MIVLNGLFCVWWLVTVAGVQIKWGSQQSYGLIILYLVFSLYWVGQVFYNTMHVTVSGVVASFYFMEGTPNMPANPTLQSAKRSLTTSFGSICFGSLIIALIRTVRYLLRQAARDGSIVAAIAHCLVGCIEGLVQYFNSYAYVHVAIYGKPFCDAAKDTWRLVKTSGIDAIINDSLIGTVLGFGALMVGVVSATAGYAIGRVILAAVKSDPNSDASGFLLVICILLFFVGMFMMNVVSMVMESGTQTTFVCLAEDPAALARTKPELYEKFKQVYPQIAWRV